MRLAEAGAAVDEERVVGLRRRFGDGERGRVGEAVRRADDERVEGVLRVEAAALGPVLLRLDPRDRRRRRRRARRRGRARGAPARRRRALGDAQLDGPLLAGDVADGRADQAEEVPLDPVACEIVGNGEDEPLTVQLEAVCLPEPGSVRGVVECPSEPTGNFTPQALRSQLDLVLHPATGPLITS